MTTPAPIARVFILLFVGCFRCTHVGAAADPEKTTPEVAQELYGASRWTVVKSAAANFGQALPDAKVELLKMTEPGGHDGAGEPICRVNVVVSKEDRIVYEFTPLAIPPGHDDRRAPGFCMDDVLELRDVTGDHVPEIIFHAGDRGASDFISDVHVLQYRPAVGKFLDIRGPGFSESVWDRFRWVSFQGRTLALVADPIEPPLDPAWKGSPSHANGKFHQYVVFGWNPKHQAFRVLFTIPSTHQIHDSAADPFGVDAKYIFERLQDYHKHRR